MAVSKAELPGSSEVRDALAEQLGREVLLISAVTGQGLDRLVHAMVRELDARAEAASK